MTRAAGVLLLLLLSLLLPLAGCPGGPSPEKAPPALLPDRPVAAAIDLRRKPWQSFRFQVRPGDETVRLSVLDATADLDLTVLSWEDGEEVTLARSATDLYDEVLVLSRFGEPALVPGKLEVRVSYDYDAPPFLSGERLDRIPFRIALAVVRDRVDQVVTSPATLEGVLDGKGGHFRCYRIQVPPGRPALRLDLDPSGADLDLLVDAEPASTTTRELSYAAATDQSRETLLLAPLPPSDSFRVRVVDPFFTEQPVLFRLYVSFDSTVPEPLRALPDLPRRPEGMALILAATVELQGAASAGSGSIVSPGGLVLTNSHVVEDPSEPDPGRWKAVIAVSLDPHRPPRETFRGTVVWADRDLDLALVQIEEGLYHQPLPEGYRFPYLPLGDPAVDPIGTPVTVAGYPDTGGLGSRVAITVTRGILSGYQPYGTRWLLKTDAMVSSGNSGGAAVDDGFRLIGVPTSVVTEEVGSGQMGYVHPVTLLPDDWLARLRKGEDAAPAPDR